MHLKCQNRTIHLEIKNEDLTHTNQSDMYEIENE